MRQFKSKFRARMCVGSNKCVVCVVLYVCVCVFYLDKNVKECVCSCLFMSVSMCIYMLIYMHLCVYDLREVCVYKHTV